MPHIVISALVGGLLLVFVTGVGGWCCFHSRSQRGCCRLYRRAIFYLFVEKAEPLIECSPGGRGKIITTSQTPDVQHHGVIDIFHAVRHRHKTRFKRDGAR